MPNPSNDQNSGSMINEKFNEASYKEESDAIIQHWNEVNNPPDGMRIENPDLEINNGKDAEIKIENQPALKSYTCPMHPEITTDQPGRCSICGMELIEKK